MAAKTLAQFQDLYPQYMHEGIIVYPIEDTLLLGNKQLHGKQTAPRPIPKPLLVDCIGDILYIADFAHSFANELKLTPFTAQQLQVALENPEPTELIKHLIMSLMLQMMEYLAATEQTISIDCQRSWLIKYYKQKVDAYSLISIQWERILNELLACDLWAGYQEDPLPSYFESYWDLSYPDRVAVLKYLTDCLFDGDFVSEALEAQNKAKDKMTKQKYELAQQINEKKAKVEDMKKQVQTMAIQRQIGTNEITIDRLERQMENLDYKLETITSKTLSLGMDRDFNEYFIFCFDNERLYVKNRIPGCEEKWYAYESATEILELQVYLNKKGSRESALIKSLANAINQLDFDDPGSQMPLEESKYTNKKSQFPVRQYNLDFCTKAIETIESNITRFLKKIDKQWEKTPKMEKWRKKVVACESISDLASCIKYLVENVDNSYNTNPDKQPLNDKHLVDRSRLNIWRSKPKRQEIFMDLLSTSNSIEDFVFLITMYSYIVDEFAYKFRMTLNSMRLYTAPRPTRKALRKKSTPVVRKKVVKYVSSSESELSGESSESESEESADGSSDSSEDERPRRRR